MSEKKEEKEVNNTDEINSHINQDDKKKKNESIINAKQANNIINSDEINVFNNIINNTEIENREKILNQRLKEIEEYIKSIKNPEEYIKYKSQNNNKRLYNINNENLNNLKNNKSNGKKKNSEKQNSNNLYRNKVKNHIFKSETPKTQKRTDFLTFREYNNEKRKKKFNNLNEDTNITNRKNYSYRDKKSKLNKEFISVEKLNKKYNDSQWNEIYNKRFKSYQEKIDEKRENSRKKIEENKKKKEDEIINLCPRKKAPIGHIIEASQKMYDEAQKRRLKKEEKKMNIQNINEIDDSDYKYFQNVYYKPYIFDRSENINSKNSKYNKYNLFLNKKEKEFSKYYGNKNNFKKNKRIPVSELNNRRFERKFKNINNNSTPPERYMFKNNYINDEDDDNNVNNNILYFDGNSYDLEEERKILTEMAKHKNLYQINDYNELKTERNNKNIIHNNNLETDKLVYEFFMRQLE